MAHWFFGGLEEGRLTKGKVKLSHSKEWIQIEAIHLWVKGTDIVRVPKSEYIKIVEWFNQYDPQKISEEKVPLSNAQVVIDTVEGATIIINYIDGRIYVSRYDDGSNSQYEFLDDAPELENFFEELIN